MRESESARSLCAAAGTSALYGVRAQRSAMHPAPRHPPRTIPGSRPARKGSLFLRPSCLSFLTFSDGWELRDGRACRGAAPTFRWPARLACAAGRIPAARRPHSARLPRQHRADLCGKQGASDLGQLALRRPLPVPDRASGCPELRPASANQPLGPRWPAISALFFT